MLNLPKQLINQVNALPLREKINADAKAVRFIPLGTYYSESLWNDYGSSQAHIFSFEVK